MENKLAILTIGVQGKRSYVKFKDNVVISPALYDVTPLQRVYLLQTAYELASWLGDCEITKDEGKGKEKDILLIGLRGFVEIYSVEWLTNPAIRQHMTPEERGNFLDDAVQLANRLDGGD